MAKILVVDDDSDNLRLVVRRLENAEHRVHGAGSAADARAFVAEKGTPDVVVLDVTMPDIDGLQLLRLLREQTGVPDLPAIFLSGRMRPADIAAGRELGATYLTKPFVATALLAAVDDILKAIDDKQRPAPQAW